MNTSLRRLRVTRAQRGVALILVLAALVLISAIVIGFLATVRQDRSSSAYYESGSTARQYADTAVTVAIAQVVDATSNPNEAWVSQPGLLRTFNAGGPVAAYKLYSSDVMKTSGVYNPEDALATEVPADWSTRSDEFTDLNNPVQIINSGTPLMIYPIVDPAAVSDVEGFTLDAGINKAAGADANALPMPVRWIYVRKGGELVDYNTAKAVDDITARIAFWGDDETCKVNINTASDAPYYDAPAVNTTQDHDLARFQPIAQEYQRYPGHPATTSLASVIKPLRDDTNPKTRSQKAVTITPRIGWGGSEGGTISAWLTRNVGKIDYDRMYTGIDELSFARNAAGEWLNGTTRNPATFSINLSRLPFFLTTESRGPELNAFNRPRITLWPFTKELVTGDSSSTPLLTPEDRLIRFASEIGSNHRKLYFQREDAWDPLNDYANIAENQQLFGYLQDLTKKAFPGATARTGGIAKNLEDKFSAQGRDQILTEMFDYLRCQVNTMNRSYEPVGGPVYSFPQGHDLASGGFNDHCPILIDAGNGMTKGFGSAGITLTEFVMQFYNATTEVGADGNVSEKQVDFFNNSTGSAGTDGKMDTMIRRVQMVVLLDFWMSVNTLLSAQPRFQVELNVSPLFLNPNPNGVPAADADKIYVRYPAPAQADNADWSTNAIGLNLPASSVNVYCSPDMQYDLSDKNLFGGSLGLSYGLRTEQNSVAMFDYLAEPAVKKTLDATASGNHTKYPFVSTIIEFRIPLKLDASGNPVLDAVTQKPLAKVEPALVGLTGAPATVTIYPGLQKPADPATLKTPGSLANLHSRTAANYLQQTSLVIGDCNLPLPKLGPNTVLIATDSWAASNSPQHKYSALGDYAKRLDYGGQPLKGRFFPGDMMMMIPNGTEGANWGGGLGSRTMALMDSFRSYSLSGTNGSKGDFRLAAARRDIPAAWFDANPSYTDAANHLGMNHLSYFLPRYQNLPASNTIRIGNLSGTNLDTLFPKISRPVPNVNYTNEGGADGRTASPALNGALKQNGSDGDFTDGFGRKGSGGMVKGPDIGAISQIVNESPYFVNRISRSGTKDDQNDVDLWHLNFTGLIYSPWKQMPSAVKFGTLPSRALDGNAWETLLFNPVPAGGKGSHRGWSELPRDHYWLDLFYMPVVEPFAITENFATNGKINLNQQIAPFTYIRRNTGLWALLRNMKVLATPSTAAAIYKTANRDPSFASTTEYRKPVDLESTVAQIQNRLKIQNDPFVTASEVCEIPMLFDGKTPANIDAYWDTLKLSGDDSREAPYNALYPRVTTKSNTFKIHFLAQTLKGKGGKWTVAGQYRGAQIVERYLDGFSGANASRAYGTGGTPGTQFPALAGSDGNGLPYYRFRKLNHQQFAP